MWILQWFFYWNEFFRLKSKCIRSVFKGSDVDVTGKPCLIYLFIIHLDPSCKLGVFLTDPDPWKPPKFTVHRFFLSLQYVQAEGKCDRSHLPLVSTANQAQIFLLYRQIKESRFSPAFMEMGEISFLVSSKLITDFWSIIAIYLKKVKKPVSHIIDLLLCFGHKRYEIILPM